VADTQLARDVWMKRGQVMAFNSRGRGFQGTQFVAKGARGRTNVPQGRGNRAMSLRVGGTAKS